MISVSTIWAATPDDLRLAVKVVSGSPHCAVNQDELAVNSQLAETLDVVSDGIVSSTVRPFRLRTVGCVFGDSREVERVAPESDSDETTVESGSDAAPNEESAASSQGERRFTRMRPPRDVVKLEDRLRLLLEPPLESLLADESLRFAARPFPYQLDGIAFLYPRHQAVLADEMGLGKTMQAITAVRLLVHHSQLRRVLLLCPKPLVTNWQREFARWAPELTVTALEGSPARRQWLWQRANDAVTIANYETVVRDAAEIRERANEYDLVILDEAQRIKNRSNVTNQIASAIPRARSWALTGTPIENSVEDLVGIFEFVAPGQIDETMQPRAIGRIAADYVLRRTKEQVLTDLPPKLFRDAEVELTTQQAASYQLAAEEGIVRLRELKSEITIQHVFELVLRLKQICNFDPTTGASSKLERLEADIEECAASGRKAIVFSQWVETLKELQRRLARFAPLEFHGQVPQRRRDGVIERFRDDPNCHLMLMTYGAGSVGLNLQFASYVFLFDRWWNPAVEDQAINRAHRIGVKSPVTITRFLTVGTIEQRINDILEKKRELFATVFGSSVSGQRKSLSSEEIFSLFDLHCEGHEPQAA
jgi:SNF2 family DNA or RNA helicase